MKANRLNIRWKSIVWRLLLLGSWVLVLYLWVPIISRLWNDRRVEPPALPTPIALRGTPFDYCTVNEYTGLAGQSEAGTQIPASPVPINTPVPVIVETTPVPTGTPALATQPVQNTFTPVPSGTPTPTPELHIEAVNVDQFEKKNFHVIFIGVGFGMDENQTVLQNMINQIIPNFADVNIDFAYIKDPQIINLSHVAQSTDFDNITERETLLTRIRQKYPADGVILLLNTDEYLGSASSNFSGTEKWAFLSENLGAFAITHELGHFLNLGDGYMDYLKSQIPDSELFYLDSMPIYLVKALNELGSIPPLYEAGICNGKKVYTFYETTNNIYGNYDPQAPNSWSDSVFTPLQIQIMNDYIRTLRGRN